MNKRFDCPCMEIGGRSDCTELTHCTTEFYEWYSNILSVVASSKTMNNQIWLTISKCYNMLRIEHSGLKLWSVVSYLRAIFWHGNSNIDSKLNRKQSRRERTHKTVINNKSEASYFLLLNSTIIYVRANFNAWCQLKTYVRNQNITQNM